ncbi:MAG: MarR family winged helix-turn-helix transcriptional regulator [Desulfitobacteriaceae bacterium]
MENVEMVKTMEEKIRQANTVIYRRGRSILAGLEVSSPQFNALLALQEFGPLTMGELCKQLFTACSTATDLADRMERVGLVERVRDSKDRRVVRMHLLPRGEEVVNAVISERQRFLAEVLNEYAEGEQPELLQILVTLAERMEKADKMMNKVI